MYWQVWMSGHTLPQDPQLSAVISDVSQPSNWRPLMQSSQVSPSALLHVPWQAPVTHALPVRLAPEQSVAQPPQLSGSILVSLHKSPHRKGNGSSHVQTPVTQAMGTGSVHCTQVSPKWPQPGWLASKSELWLAYGTHTPSTSLLQQPGLALALHELGVQRQWP
jgi:hypothetical protein